MRFEAFRRASERHEPRARDHVIPAASDGEQTEGDLLIPHQIWRLSDRVYIAETRSSVALAACVSCRVVWCVTSEYDALYRGLSAAGENARCSSAEVHATARDLHHPTASFSVNAFYSRINNNQFLHMQWRAVIYWNDAIKRRHARWFILLIISISPHVFLHFCVCIQYTIGECADYQWQCNEIIHVVVLGTLWSSRLRWRTLLTTLKSRYLFSIL